jgi:hypothetical protein
MARRRGATRREAATFTEALRRAALDVETSGPDRGRRKLDLIARRMVEMAVAGDLAAAREIGDRLEGRPLQRVEAEGDASALGFAALLAAVNEERRRRLAETAEAPVLVALP